ncbi:MAG: ABC transporter permease [Bacteroidales bacterium]|nr:ABC transporter permease [Bacteroidales bacterium]
MNKILLIIRREYLTRVRKRSFIVMTILGPVLMAALIILPIYISTISQGSMKKIAVLDETSWFYQKFKNQPDMKFTYVSGDFEKVKDEALKNKEMLFYIPLPKLNVPVYAELYSENQAGLGVSTYVKMVMKNEVQNKKLLAEGIDPEKIKSSKVEIDLELIKVNANGKEKHVYSDAEEGLAVFSGILIYIFIFMFGAQVMRGIMEEKSNRIVEVIISSVKPFQLMMGKIIGIAFVGITQFLLWIILTLGLVGVFQTSIGSSNLSSGLKMLAEQKLSGDNAATAQVTHFAVAQINEVLSTIDFRVMVLSFLFFFLAGYLLYASLFAAIGGAVDQDADAQQFMLPVSMPLIFSVAMMGIVAAEPNGAIAFWLSMIPFTSPVIMMLRIPFGVPWWQVGISAGILLLTFIVTTFIAGKIYKVGILIYGKKVNYAVLWKWLRN